eukprot:gene13618-9753_t
MSVSRASSTSPVDFAPVVPDPADSSVVGGSPTLATSSGPPFPTQHPLLGGLVDAVTRLTLLLDQRFPAGNTPVVAPVPVPPPPVVTHTPPATVAASPASQSISPVHPHSADLTFEALGAGQGLYLYTPSVKIPL